MNETPPPSNEGSTPSTPVGQPVSPQPPAPSTTSTSSVVALILGILSLTCCGFISGIPAIFLGRSEMKAADEGRIDASNRTMAKVGMILGIVGTCLSCLGTLFYLLVLALGLTAGFTEGMSGF